MSTATSPMGLKRICTSCGIRFYDLNKRPIVCPSCDTEFTGEIKVKSKRGRAAAEDPIKTASKAVAKPIDKDDEDIIEDEDDGIEVVSLDDAEDDDTDDDDAPLGDDADDLDDIPDFDDDLDDDLGGDDDDTILEDDDD